MFSDEYFMKIALKEAEKALNNNEVPVGAVIVSENKIIAKAYNSVETLNDATAHAEMLAITSASNYIGSKYLNECAIYVTIEPCIMCAGAIAWAQIGKLVYGARDEKKGYSKIKNYILHPKTQVIQCVLENECVLLLKQFFKEKR
ncbi:MAG: nucleoside deaminase [Bacteroidales bacterium]|nr:nucleoside deaminase [Bacteroidales bacterium]